MLRLMFLLLPLPGHALPQSEPVLCAEGTAITPSPLQPVRPHCAPAPQQFMATQRDA